MAESPQPENNILPPWGCNICFEESREPVCTTCGHLFCWPCLYTWVHDMRKQACPVCRAPLTVDANVVPVYVATRAEPSQGAAAPTSTTPPRPHPARRRPAPSARAESNITSAETQVPRDDLNPRHLYRERRERLSLVQGEQAEERTWLAQEEAASEEYESLLEADGRCLSQLRRELMRRRNAASTAGQGSSNRQMDQLHRSRNASRRGMMRRSSGASGWPSLV